ncbi:hypothetical protein N9933_01160 [bacterium]|nr:hypothetical protein [bacterium]
MTHEYQTWKQKEYTREGLVGLVYKLKKASNQLSRVSNSEVTLAQDSLEEAILIVKVAFKKIKLSRIYMGDNDEGVGQYIEKAHPNGIDTIDDEESKKKKHKKIKNREGRHKYLLDNLVVQLRVIVMQLPVFDPVEVDIIAIEDKINITINYIKSWQQYQ